MYGRPNPNYEPFFQPMFSPMPMSYDQAMEAKRSIEDYEKRLKKETEDALLKKQDEERKKKNEYNGPHRDTIAMWLIGLSPIIIAIATSYIIESVLSLAKALK